MIGLIENIGEILQWIDDYGADKVFMVFFFMLYWGTRRKFDKLQDARLEDSKEALGALIEAKLVLGELGKNVEKLVDDSEEHEKKDIEEFGKIRGKLDRIIDKLEATNDS